MIIKPKDSVELLGVVIDETLNFQKHINNLFRSAMCQQNVIFRLKNSFSIHTSTTIH